MTHSGIAWWWYLMVGLMFATWVAMMVWADWRDHQEWDRWYAWQKERDALERMSDGRDWNHLFPLHPERVGGDKDVTL